MTVTNFAQIYDLSRSRTRILVYGNCKTQCPVGIEGLFFLLVSFLYRENLFNVEI